MTPRSEQPSELLILEEIHAGSGVQSGRARSRAAWASLPSSPT